MPDLNIELPPPVNHVFVDFENVHKVDLTIIGKKAVNFILLVGPKQTKFSVDLVEKLFEHALSVQLCALLRRAEMHSILLWPFMLAGPWRPILPAAFI